MDPIEVLAQAVIDTLREFSKEKRPITPATLQEAFSGRRDLISLLFPVGQGLIAPGRETLNSPKAKPETPEQSNAQNLSGLRSAFLKIIDSLGPVIKNESDKRFGELQKKINECESLQPLGLLGEQIGQMAAELMNKAVVRMDFSNDFLVELSKDLNKMEEQLSTYQDYNRETHQISSEFHNDLLSYTDDMHRVFDSGSSMQDARQLIASKLNTISKAIEVKSQSDVVRLQEADAKIVELQNNL